MIKEIASDGFDAVASTIKHLARGSPEEVVERGIPGLVDKLKTLTRALTLPKGGVTTALVVGADLAAYLTTSGRRTETSPAQTSAPDGRPFAYWNVGSGPRAGLTGPVNV